MKVVFLRTDSYRHIDLGGSFSHIRGFLNGLKKLGHEYAVISSGDLPVGGGVSIYKVAYSNFFSNLPEVHSIVYNFRLIRHAKRIIEKEKPDFIYHRHSEFNFSSTVLAKHFNIPLVLECNGSEVWIKKNWGRIYLEKMLKLAEDIQFIGADVITVVSHVMKNDLIRLGVDADKILVNPNGVDPDVFHPDVDGSSVRRRYHLTKTIVAGFVGTFGPWHGLPVLAKSIKHCVKKNNRIRFLIIGEGTLRNEVENIIRDDGVTEYAILTGSVAHEKIPRHLAACDILLSPHVENPDGTTFFGSPTKLFEYMAMAKPTVASGVGQIGEVIQDGVNGLLMKHEDEIDLAKKILILAHDKNLRDRLGAQARRDAVAHFSWTKNAQRVIEAYKKIIHSR